MSGTEWTVTGLAQLDDARPKILPDRTVHLAERGSFFVRVSDTALDGTAVVLLHGLGATADLNWSAALPALSGSFRVVAPDLRGHGDAAAYGPFTLEDAADDIAALIDALALGPAIVVGYSMGGAIAQLVCRRHPGTVRGLVLCRDEPQLQGLLARAPDVRRRVARPRGVARRSRRSRPRDGSTRRQSGCRRPARAAPRPAGADIRRGQSLGRRFRARQLPVTQLDRNGRPTERRAGASA